MRRKLIALALALIVAGGANAQVVPPVAAPQPAPPPATKLEAFKPSAGSVVTFGYNEMGSIGKVSLDVRELRDARGTTVRGIVVDIRESEYRHEKSFVDADEIPELVKAIDALRAVKVNPTSFEHFEVRYTTRGELQLTAFNMDGGPDVHFAIQAGRTLKAQDLAWELSELLKFREMLTAAQAKLAKAK